MTTKQLKTSKRQDILSTLVNNAISCDYISSINRILPNGLIVKTINFNHNGNAYYMWAFNPETKEEKIYTSNESVEIEGVDLYYIIVD